MQQWFKLLLCLLIPIAAAAQKNSFTITGRLTKWNNGAKIYLDYSTNGHLYSDSAAITNGTFKFTGKAEGVITARMTLSNSGKGRDYEVYAKANGDVLYFKYGNEHVFITAVDSIYNAVVKGSRVYEGMKAFEKETGPSLQDIGRHAGIAWEAMTEAQRRDTTYVNSIIAAVDKLKALRKEKLIQYAKQHPDSYFAVESLHEALNAYFVPLNEVEEIFNHLSSPVKLSYDGQQLNGEILARKKIRTGVPAPVFTQNDVHGKPVTLSDFRGKWVLVEFWASWCSPCRAESPNLLAQYEKYKTKGFEIIGISADHERDRWTNAIKEDGLTWAQLSDLKGHHNQVMRLYGVSNLPANFLVDTAGIVVAEQLRGEQLNQKLREIFNRTPDVTAFRRKMLTEKMAFLEQYLHTGVVPAKEERTIDTMRFLLAQELTMGGRVNDAEYWVSGVKTSGRYAMYAVLAGMALERKDTGSAALRFAYEAMQMLADTAPLYTRALYAGTYAGHLALRGRYKEALPYQEQAVAAFNRQYPKMNELYTEILARVDTGAAITELEDFIRKNVYTDRMKEQLRLLYSGAPGDKVQALEDMARTRKLAEVNAKALNMPAPPFSLKNMQGELVSLSTLKGKVVVLDFWATWCKPCLASFAGMQKAVDKYKDNTNVIFLFVDTGENFGSEEERSASVNGLLTRLGYRFNVLYDVKEKGGKYDVADRYGVTGIPSKVIICKNGSIRFRTSGGSGNERADLQELDLMIANALSEN